MILRAEMSETLTDQREGPEDGSEESPTPRIDLQAVRSEYNEAGTGAATNQLQEAVSHGGLAQDIPVFHGEKMEIARDDQALKSARSPPHDQMASGQKDE